MMNSPTPRSPFRFPPLGYMAIAVALGVLVISIVTILAHRQPWLGIRLGPTPNKKGAVVLDAEGPGSSLPKGTIILDLSSGHTTMPLEALDLTIEPDGSMGDYETYDRFLTRQDQIARIQASSKISFTAEDGRIFPVSPDAGGRPLSSLPADFWVQLVVGITAWLVSAAVFAFRPHDAAARYLLLSGASTLVFSPAAALYTTRELAINGTLFRWASDLNFFGGSIFTASFIAMLFYYPRRIAPGYAGRIAVLVFIAWFVMQHVGVFESMTFARRFLVMVGVGFTFILAGIHWFRTGRDPVARAALQWFLLSWMLGTSLFAVFILLPQLFGVDTSSLQGYSFLLFLLVYGGLAFGILRYRLFELGDWWRRMAVWTITVVLLVLLDMLFLFGLKFSTGASIALTLVICGLVWLPLRAWVWRYLPGGSSRQHGEIFRQAMEVALTPHGDNPGDRWQKLLVSVFDPLNVIPASGKTAVAISRDGLAMDMPGIGPIPSVCLEFARGGRRLFSPHDIELANELIAVLAHAFESRSAYERGTKEERSRIARDIHDNIGAQLLAALHSSNPHNKDSKIRETLADLRDVINNASSENLDIGEALAELRIETSERLAAAGIDLHWNSKESDHPELKSSALHALRSIVREAVSNIIRHSEARCAKISFHCSPEWIALEVSDDGKGFNSAEVFGGHGIPNLRSRLERLAGTLDIDGDCPGTRLMIRIPTDK